jgi:biopolymer transport protein ExbD
VAFQGPRVGGDGESSEEDEGGGVGLFADINITPLTDVILVLLVIFMVASSAMVDAMREGMIDVTLPQASTATKDKVDTEALIVGITAEGQIFVHGSVVPDNELLKVLEDEKKKAPNSTIVVQADGSLRHSKVIDVIDKLRKAGYTNVGIAAEEPGD